MNADDSTDESLELALHSLPAGNDGPLPNAGLNFEVDTSRNCRPTSRAWEVDSSSCANRAAACQYGSRRSRIAKATASNCARSRDCGWSLSGRTRPVKSEMTLNSQIRLLDERTVRVRPAWKSDAELFVVFFAGLSARSRDFMHGWTACKAAIPSRCWESGLSTSTTKSVWVRLFYA